MSLRYVYSICSNAGEKEKEETKVAKQEKHIDDICDSQSQIYCDIQIRRKIK